MKLISCDGCGVVLDAEKMHFPYDRMFDDNGQVKPSRAVWDKQKQTYVPFMPCPVCSTNITDDGSYAL